MEKILYEAPHMEVIEFWDNVVTDIHNVSIGGGESRDWPALQY